MHALDNLDTSNCLLQGVETLTAWDPTVRGVVCASHGCAFAPDSCKKISGQRSLAGVSPVCTDGMDAILCDGMQLPQIGQDLASCGKLDRPLRCMLPCNLPPSTKGLVQRLYQRWSQASPQAGSAEQPAWLQTPQSQRPSARPVLSALLSCLEAEFSWQHASSGLPCCSCLRLHLQLQRPAQQNKLSAICLAASQGSLKQKELQSSSQRQFFRCIAHSTQDSHAQLMACMTANQLGSHPDTVAVRETP